jgi:hypothetical protein
MSDRIRELIKEHGFMDDEDLYQFAEIIINECVKVSHDAGKVVAYTDRQVDPATYCGNSIIYHFYGDKL